MICTAAVGYLRRTSRRATPIVVQYLSSTCPVFVQYLSSVDWTYNGHLLHIYCTHTAHIARLLLGNSLSDARLHLGCSECKGTKNLPFPSQKREKIISSKQTCLEMDVKPIFRYNFHVLDANRRSILEVWDGSLGQVAQEWCIGLQGTEVEG